MGLHHKITQTQVDHCPVKPLRPHTIRDEEVDRLLADNDNPSEDAKMFTLMQDLREQGSQDAHAAYLYSTVKLLYPHPMLFHN